MRCRATVFDPEAVALRPGCRRRRARDRLTHLELRPARDAQVAAPGRPGPPGSWSTPTSPAASSSLWSHQAEAAELAWPGSTPSSATGTASGKSLAYLLPTLVGDRGSVDGPAAAATRCSTCRRPRRWPRTSWRRWRGSRCRACAPTTYDGDSTREERDWARSHANYVLTNPDMLHRTMLPAHARWAPFWGSLRYVVVDECHHYRGVFGVARRTDPAPAAPGRRALRRRARPSCWPRRRPPSPR